MKQSTIFIAVIGVLILGGLITVFTASPAELTTDKYVGLAQCLKDKGAVFYGAFWCQHCKAQKKMFSAAVSSLPYVECSTPDGNAQTAICIEKKIESYPTWEFADSTRLTGEIPLATLADKTGCTLPL